MSNPLIPAGGTSASLSRSGCFPQVGSVTCGKSLYGKPVSIKETEESCNFIRTKGESPPRHTPAGLSLSRFQRAQPPFILSSRPHVALFLSPLAEVLGKCSLPEPPTPYPPLNLSFYPKVQKSRLVKTHFSVSGAKLSGLCNKPAS